ncbi:MAG: sugar ABC transporter permease [Anaerolineae bacterium]|nr:sugar ABC transporter permease [Anaerolineae bacterium]
MSAARPGDGAVAAQAASRRRRRSWLEQIDYFRKNYLAGYLFISPWLIGFFVFTFGPFLASLYLSLTKYSIVGAPEWVGLGNYAKIFTDDRYFLTTLFNTFYYVIFHVPGVQIIALFLAMVLAQDLRGIAIYRTVFYLPTVTTGVATAILWQWIFNTRFGVINLALAKIGIEGPGWLTTRKWAMPALIIMSLWGVGGPMVIYLAGIKNVPMSLYEAAQIDGASKWRQFFQITLPLITASIFYNTTMGIIGSFQVFTQAYVITRGGPANATLFYVLYLYRTAFENLHMGYASALAWILFLIILLLTMVQLAMSRRWVYYESARDEGGAR